MSRSIGLLVPLTVLLVPLTVLLVPLTVLLAVLAALPPARASARAVHAPTTISVWSYATGNEQKVFQAAYDRFNRSQSAVRVQGTWGVNNDKTLTAISGGQPPDVVDLGGADPLCSWASKGALTDLTPLLQSSHITLGAFVPQALSYGACTGKYYGITGAFDGLFLYYNTNIFARAHLAPPRTIADLDSDAARLTIEKNGRIAQLGFSPNGGISGDNGLQVWAYTFGGNWWNPRTKAVTPTDRGNVAALAWEASYYKKYGVKALSDFNAASYGSGPLGSDPFAFGKVAMELGGEWLHAFLNEYAPTVHFGEVPIPVLHPGSKPVMYPNGDVWIIPSTAAHRTQAWQFLRWLEQPAQYKPICNGMVNLPQFSALYDNTSWANAALRESVALWKQYQPQPMPQLSNFVKYESLIANAEQQATLGKMSPAAALGQIAGQLGQ